MNPMETAIPSCMNEALRWTRQVVARVMAQQADRGVATPQAYVAVRCTATGGLEYAVGEGLDPPVGWNLVNAEQWAIDPDRAKRN